MAKNYDWDIDFNDKNFDDWDYTPFTKSSDKKSYNKSNNTKAKDNKSLNNSKVQTSNSTKKSVSQRENTKQPKERNQLNDLKEKSEGKQQKEKKSNIKALVCEMCGSNDIIKQKGLFVCQNCGTKYTVEEARKIMHEGPVDVRGTVKIDNSTELQNLYKLARRAKADNNSENAQKYYGQIVIKDPSSWEANFYTTYYQSMNCKIGEIGMAAVRITNCEDTVFDLIKENVKNPDEQRKAVNEVAVHLIAISNMLFNAYKKYYDGIDCQIRYRYTQEYVNNCSAARDIVYRGGDWIVRIFRDTYGYCSRMLETGCNTT